MHVKTKNVLNIVIRRHAYVATTLNRRPRPAAFPRSADQEPIESPRLSESAGRDGGHRARRDDRPGVPARDPPAVAGERQGDGGGGGEGAAVAAVHLPEGAEAPPLPLLHHRRAERLDRPRALLEDSTTPEMMGWG